ncbi:MAG: WG repeat-containing protein [Myxococcota bacterium]
MISDDNSILAAVLEDGQWGFIRRDGSHAFTDRWPQVRTFSSGLAAVNVGGTRQPGISGAVGGGYRYIDAAGRVVIPGPFRNPGVFWNGFLVTDVGDGTAMDVGVVERAGEILTRGFADLRGFVGAPISYAISGDKSRAGFIKPNGSWLFELPVDAQVGAVQDGMIPVATDGQRWGFIDTAGKTVIEPRFERAGSFFDGRAAVRIDEKWGFIDKAGTLVVAAQWDNVSDFSEGRCAVQRGERWGFIDTAGQVIIEPAYPAVRDFHGGLAAVMDKSPAKGDPKDNVKKDDNSGTGRVGYLDPSGAWAIAPRFAAAYDFSHGRAAFVDGNALGFIDKSGKVVIQPRFTRVHRFVDVSRSNGEQRSE